MTELTIMRIIMHANNDCYLCPFMIQRGSLSLIKRSFVTYESDKKNVDSCGAM